MHTVKLPEMEWVKCDAITKCTESGIYLWRSGECSGEEKFTKHDYFAPGYEYAGPITFDIPEPMPEPLQLGSEQAFVHWYGDHANRRWKCASYDDARQVLACHPDKRIAILAHNAAVRVMMEHSK